MDAGDTGMERQAFARAEGGMIQENKHSKPTSNKPHKAQMGHAQVDQRHHADTLDSY